MSESEKAYKQTLNLPETSFPMKAGLTNLEPKIISYWQGIYPKIRNKFKGKPKFVLHDGPPYANGPIHMGHALNKVLKDFIVKSRTLQGYDSPYVPGWDCHGLPIEAKVEKEMGQSGVRVDPKKFRKACREYAESQIELQKKEFIRLGVIGDWDNHYETKDFKVEAGIMRYIARLVQNGNIFKAEKSLHWCFSCQCALAEAEVEYNENHKSMAIDVAFLAEKTAEIAKIFKVSEIVPSSAKIGAIIWTTTPWTIPANQAVALNPEFEYALIRLDAEFKKEKNLGFDYFIVAKELANQCHLRFFGADLDEKNIISICKGKNLELQNFKHPFYDRFSPIWLADYVSLDAGTGCVHTAPTHGSDDYYLGVKYGAKLFKCVEADGTYNQKAEGFEGVHVLKSDVLVLERLMQQGLLAHQYKLTHSYPFCWRHKTPLIFLATPQWFISMDKNELRDNTLEAIKNVRWIPNWGQERISNMIAKRPDWCISRQRSWGSPLGLVYHKKTGEIHPKMPEILEKIAQEVEKKGIDAWFDFDLKQIIDDSDDYIKSNDVLDVWLDSGTTHETVLKQSKDLTFPADLYLEGSDQHRGWFHSSLLTSVALNNTAPYKQVLTHGFVVDEKGRKMSKSLGNVIEPQKIVSTWGADILRLWVAGADYSAELSLSNSVIQSTTDTYRRIRNTLRFLLANLADFDENQDLMKFDDLLLLDQFALNRLANLQTSLLNESNGYYTNYQFHNALRKLSLFCTEDMGGFYLDVIKDRLYTCQKKSKARLSCQTAMHYILNEFVLLLAPIISFTAEEVWQTMGKKDSILMHSSTLIKAELEVDKKDLIHLVQKIKHELSKHMEQMRNDKKIGASLEAEVVVFADEKTLNQLIQVQSELHFLWITSKVELRKIEDAPKDALDTEIKNLKFMLNKSNNKKCSRCWHHNQSVGKNSNHPDICGRCVSNIEGDGENRKFA